MPSLPQNISAEATSASEILVIWAAPEHPNGVITGYDLSWKMVENDRSKSVSGNVETNSTVFTKFKIQSLGLYSESLHSTSVCR